MRKALAWFMVLGCALMFTTSPAGADAVKIGSLVSTTGDLAAHGPPINNGSMLAAKDVNAAGGVLGRNVEIILRDTQTNPTAAVDAAKKLVDIDNVVGIAGALSSGVTVLLDTLLTSNICHHSPKSLGNKRP